MLAEYGIQKNWLPQIVKENSADFGKVAATEEGLKCITGVQISGVLGDQHAACLGHILREGQAKNTYGTGCFLL